MKKKGVLFGGFVLLAIGLCTFGMVFAGFYAWQYFQTGSALIDNEISASPSLPWTVMPSSTNAVTPPSATVTSSSPVIPTITAESVEFIQQSSSPSDTLSLFENTLIPINDPIEQVKRFEGLTNIPTQHDAPLRQYALGDRETFWILNSNDNKNYQVQAILRVVTDHTYFWIEDGIEYDTGVPETLMETFESRIYPANHAFFGSEWSPGVDADPRIFILYARNMGNSVSGYFSPPDEYLPVVSEFSNTHEMIFLNADTLRLSSDFANSVLAHEHQHMIQWYLDRSEETWLIEGLANLAAFINGYSVGGADYSYAQTPDMQLNYWSTDPQQRSSNYGASFLFLAYFLDRLGESAMQELAAHQANGISSVDIVLEELAIPDGQTGSHIQADDIFADWEIANLLHDSTVADGRYIYHNYPDAPESRLTESIDTCPASPIQREVSQYGVDYIRINCRGSYKLVFEGATEVNVLPEKPFSGDFVYYSNHGDVSAMTISQRFDFTNHTGPLTISYWTWFDIEQDYDYAYLTASLDGINWEILQTPSGTDQDPVGNNLGWGYTGLSGTLPGETSGARWVSESIDISQFAGKKVWFAFEYHTDSAVYSEGFLIDDIAIPEIDYFTDFETDSGGWQSAGFVRIQNLLPQKYRVSLILVGDKTRVEKITLDDQNRAEIPVVIDSDTDYAVLVISGTTRFTRQKAIYQIQIQ